jgi:ankyrin repeat protein
MNVDLFKDDPSWLYYLYTSLAVMGIAMGGYILLRSRRRATRIFVVVAWAPFAVLILLWEQLSKLLPKRSKKNYKPVVDLENQELDPKDEFATVLKWAASSGRTDVIHKLLQDSKRDKTKTSGSLSSGEAIMMAIKNGHEDAAKYLIDSEHFDEYRDENNATLVHWAAKHGLASVVEKLASKGINLNDKDADGRTPLDYALDSNDEDTMNLLLKGGKHINRQDTVNIQTLHFSARKGDISMIKQLHEKGSSLEARDGKGQTVIFHAVKGKQYATMKWLLEKNTNIHAVDKQGFTALHIAAQECDLAATKILVEKGANVNALSSERLTPLLCIVNSQGIDVLRYLHEKGADIDAVDNDLDRIGHKIARKGDSAALLCKAAYDLGCNMKISGKQGNTPAHLAAESGSIAILKFLVEKSIDVRTCQNIAGYTPLMMAAGAGKADSVRFLLENGCTHDIVDTNGKAIVELAIGWGNPDVMQVLQDFGAKFDSVDSNNNAPHPVWHAIWNGLECASFKQVLDSGLDVDYTYCGISLLQCAIEAGNTDVVRLLIDAGANVGRTDPHGWSPLHSAAFSGDVEAFLLALQRSKNPSPKDEHGWTPLDLAAFYRHEDLVKILDPDGKVTEFAWSRRSEKSSMNATHHYVPPMADSALTGYAEAPGSAR